MKRVLIVLVSVLLVTGMACSASALYIDFTDSVWSDADGEKAYTVTYDGLEVTLNGWSVFRDLDLTYQDDGIGLNSVFGEDDEVDSWETLQISFNPDVIVTAIYLYNVESGETAWYSLDDEIWVSASGSDGTASLFEIITGSDELTSWIQLSAGSGLFYSDNVTLAGLEVTTAPVPEPATMLLLGTGLLGIAGMSRKKMLRK